MIVSFFLGNWGAPPADKYRSIIQPRNLSISRTITKHSTLRIAPLTLGFSLRLSSWVRHLPHPLSGLPPHRNRYPPTNWTSILRHRPHPHPHPRLRCPARLPPISQPLMYSGLGCSPRTIFLIVVRAHSGGARCRMRVLSLGKDLATLWGRGASKDACG
jgi:hypothetical protein